MDKLKELSLTDCDEELCWKRDSVKQGFAVKFQRGLLKAPKMQYFVLTADGLWTFEGKPNRFAKPLSFLPFQQLSSIKLPKDDVNNSKLSCMQLTSKNNSTFTLGFYRKEDRDKWMCGMMELFSQSLLTTHVFDRTSKCWDEIKHDNLNDYVIPKKDKLATEHCKGKTLRNFQPASLSVHDKLSVTGDCSQLEQLDFNMSGKELVERTTSSGSNSSGQNLRLKRRKDDKGSIKKSKSYDSLALHDLTNNRCVFSSDDSTLLRCSKDQTQSILSADTSKRKSVPNINVISNFPSAWLAKSKEQLFGNSCDFEHRDSLVVKAKALFRNKTDSKNKTTLFSKIRSRFEHATKYVH
ncbi:uncharacterized protein LOC124448250 [Xenia sp. Carnegie-2017]|uniref:uncharacterized protein LOC124448250 n=1 Tax=Xenia sp. Carnegie-2017 TaxID=2897299 RepID=UPI001F046ECA|nr:uncharacterized protein LOC124448250 [Xenia sp. Carnegie-2017]